MSKGDWDYVYYSKRNEWKNAGDSEPKEEVEQNITALEREVITFLQETEDCKTTNKKGKEILSNVLDIR